MKKILFSSPLTAAIIAAFTFAACTDSESVVDEAKTLAENTPQEVQFGTYMGTDQQGTRAATTTNQNYTKGMIGNVGTTADFTTPLDKAQFGVFAYYTGAMDYDPASGTNTWRTETGAEKYPNFMYNQQMKYATADPANMWVYSPVKYWPNGNDAANAASTPSNTALAESEQKLSFYAFAPYTAVTTTAYTGNIPDNVSTNDVIASKTMTTGKTNGVTAVTGNDSPSNIWVKYLMPNAQVDEAVDLLWGVRGSYQYKETDNENNPTTALTSLDGTSYNINLTKQIVKESDAQRVKFLFKHALAKIGGQTVSTEDVTETPGTTDQIGFKIVADVDVNTETTSGDHDDQATYFGSDFDKTVTLITLKAVKIQDGKSASDDGEITKVTGKTSNIFNAGWFNIETGTWEGGAVETTGATVKIVANYTDADATNTIYTINPAIKELENGAGKSTSTTNNQKLLADSDGKKWSTDNPTGVTTEAQPLFAKENVPGLLLIPGSTAQTLYITVDYLVRTADPNLSKGFSEVEQVITNTVDISGLNPNKYYTIIIHLGMTSVKFEAVVADWETANSGTFNENGHYTEGSEATKNESHVWLPSNVVK